MRMAPRPGLIERPAAGRTNTWLALGVAVGLGFQAVNLRAAEPAVRAMPPPAVQRLEPPEQEFFGKRLDSGGIPIKGHADVVDEAFYQAHQRLEMVLAHLPAVRSNLVQAGAELHIIGRNQVTSDLPDNRSMKGKPFDGELTVDQRTRGLGGLRTSCGEENLLRLEVDRYRGRDICVHEFAHNIFDHIPQTVRQRFADRLRAALAAGRWEKAYAAVNPHEFFAELSMWYWGTHGDLHMTGAKPADGPEGLKAYDSDSFVLLDDFYQGRIDLTPSSSRDPGTPHQP